MKLVRVILLLSALGLSVLGQQVNVTANKIKLETPSGSCSSGSVRVTSAGVLWTCVSGTWTAVDTAAGGGTEISQANVIDRTSTTAGAISGRRAYDAISTWTPAIRVATKSGHGFAVLDPLYNDGSGIWQKALATGITTLPTAFVTKVVDANNFEYATSEGEYSITAHGLSVGSTYYLQDAGGVGTSPGTITYAVFGPNSSSLIQYYGVRSQTTNFSATQRVLGRNTAGAGAAEEVSASGVLDWVGNTQGNLLYRSASGWSALATGTAGNFLVTGGAGANPSWTNIISAINGGSAANDDITIQGTTNATRTSSYVILQPTAGNVGIGTTTPSTFQFEHSGSIGPSADIVTNLGSAARRYLDGYMVRVNAQGFVSDTAGYVSFGGVRFLGTTNTSPGLANGWQYNTSTSGVEMVSSGSVRLAIAAANWTFTSSGSWSWAGNNKITWTGGNFGIATTAPDTALEVNLGTSSAFRLSYNDADGSAANKVDQAVSSGGNWTVTPSGGVANIAGALIMSGTPQTLTGAGAVNLMTYSTLLVTTGANALTLAAGSEGQLKFIRMKTDGGDGTLTVTNLEGGTTITFNDAGDFVYLLYQDGKWHVLTNSGCAVA